MARVATQASRSRIRSLLTAWSPSSRSDGRGAERHDREDPLQQDGDEHDPGPLHAALDLGEERHDEQEDRDQRDRHGAEAVDVLADAAGVRRALLADGLRVVVAALDEVDDPEGPEGDG